MIGDKLLVYDPAADMFYGGRDKEKKMFANRQRDRGAANRDDARV